MTLPSPCRASRAPQRLGLSFAALALLIAGLSPPTAAAGQVSLVGVWRLVRYVDTPEGGPPVHAFGTEPIGLFVFTADGQVSINIMRNPPNVTAPSTDPDPDACVPGWYCAYFGAYTVDSKRGVFIVRVLGGNIPAYWGTEQTRSFVVSGDRLVISETYLQGSQRVHAERVLIRNLAEQKPPTR